MGTADRWNHLAQKYLLLIDNFVCRVLKVTRERLGYRVKSDPKALLVYRYNCGFDNPAIFFK